MATKKQLLLIYLFLTAATLIAFRQLNQCDFINYDDPLYVTENIHIRHGITTEAIRWAFTTGCAANWHPVTWISHMLDVQLFGLKPRWHHLTNLLFHIANTLLLFFVFHRMTKAPWKSAFVAALFALHPLHVESVAWVAERKDVLSTFFWMLTMCAYVHYVGRPRLKSYLAVFTCLALGLMAKPMLVTLPFVLLLLDFWPLRRFEQKTSDKYQRALIRSLLIEKIPLFALAALSSIATFIAQKKGGAVVSLEGIAPGVRIANAFVSYIIYIGKTIWPDNLAVFYPHPGLWPFWQVLGAVLSLIAVTAIVIRWAKRFPYLAMGWLWFAGTLVPVIGIVQVGRQAMADRYTYVPLIGLFVIAAWGIPELLKNWRYRKEALLGAQAIILPCLLIVTSTQTGYWRNSIELYDHALKVTSNNDTIYNNRGEAYCGLGNLRRAIPDFDKAVEINPHYAEAYFNRGITYGKLGNQRQAIEDFERANEACSERKEPYYIRGFAYSELGDFREAIENYDRAIEINSVNAEAYNGRGDAYGKLGDFRRAISDYDRAIGINPRYATALNNRGFAYGALGNYKQAIEDYTRAIEINSDYVKAYYNRGIAYNEIGNHGQAVEDLKTAARLSNEDSRELLRSMGLDW